jgi:hypothetical protein
LASTRSGVVKPSVKRHRGGEVVRRHLHHLIPAIAILRAGSAGALAPVVDMVNVTYFWATGILSSFLGLLWSSLILLPIFAAISWLFFT